MPPSLIPPGWTADPEEMADCTEYFGELLKLEKYDISKSGIPRALLADDVSGVPDVLVEISDPNGQHDCQHYIWNRLSDYVSKVSAPNTAKEIIPLLLTNGKTKKGLVIRKLESFGAPVGIIGKLDKPTFVVPPGWTTDPKELDFCSECFGDLIQINNYDTPVFGIPRALLADDKSGVPNVLVEISDPNGQHDRQYYIWNQLTNFVSEVLAPKTAKEIAPLLLADGQAKEGLAVRRLKSGGAPVIIATSDKPTFVAPLGWTADPEEMADLDEAFEELIRNEYDIPKSGIPRTLLANEGAVPDVLVELSAPNGQDDRQYYIWNQLSGYVSKVVAPTTAEKIVPLLTNGGGGGGNCILGCWNRSSPTSRDEGGVTSAFSCRTG